MRAPYTHFKNCEYEKWELSAIQYWWPFLVDRKTIYLRIFHQIYVKYKIPKITKDYILILKLFLANFIGPSVLLCKSSKYKVSILKQ